LPKCDGVCLVSLVRRLCLAFLVVLLGWAGFAAAQTTPEKPFYARVNTFGVFAAYSGDSSHFVLGYAQNRKLLNIGVVYSRRLHVGSIVNWQYNAELMPVALESDPVTHFVDNQQTPTTEVFVSDFRQSAACVANSASYSNTLANGVTYSGTLSTTCKRTWTVGEAFSPVGLQWNFRPRHRLQPVVIGHGGYMYSTQAIPIDYAGSFNFTFDLGAGVEFYRSNSRSIRADYRYHHISNHATAATNPGIDSGVFQVTYAFGR
jgi:opacity protein-like surface antigen